MPESPDDVDVQLAEQLLDSASLLRRQVRRSIGGLWPATTLSGAQVELLRFVRRNPATSVATAAAELGLAPNTVSTLVRQLVDSGLLRRAVDPADRRVARLDLTPIARRRITRWRDARIALTAEALAGLTPAERKLLDRAIPVISRLAVEIGTEKSEETA